MVLTANDFLNQMIAQARLLDPSISAATGTPEWKIFSSVAQTLASNQVDLTGLSQSLNISSKVGSSLDKFVSNFGMQRQGSTPGQGYVVFTRPTAASVNITIPQSTVIQANGSINTNGSTTVQYTTTTAGTIPQGGTSSGPVPVQAVTTGSSTNVPAGGLNQFVGTIPAGVSAVTNPVAITTGLDFEDDDLFKSRFQNTWARNLSGTTSSYLAVALAGAFSTKAVCIGQQSTYIEYIQVPDADDAGLVNGVAKTVQGIGTATTTSTLGGGNWTTALSDIPFAKNIFTSIPTFISDNGNGTYYYQQGVDYIFNLPPSIQGDALREYLTTAPTGETVSIGTGTNIPVEDPVGFPTSGSVIIQDSTNGFSKVSYTGILPQPDTLYPQYYLLTGITAISVNGGATTVAGNPIYFVPTSYAYRPNFTFTNVSTIIDQASGQYTTLFDVTTGSWVTNSATVNPSDTLVTVQTLTPGQVIQSEFRYVSTASRNDISANINNCIDVYVNGSNPQQTSCVFLPPNPNTNPLTAIFGNNSSSAFYAENFRRDGEPERRPNIGNYWTPLFNPPITSLPSTITGPDGATFFLGVHYWLVHEVSNLSNSARSRDGIEWSFRYWGDNQTTVPTSNQGYLPGGPTTSTIMNYGQSRLPVEVDNYANDANIINMQATYDSQSPASNDVLAHGATMRYFKFDVTLMYSRNASPAAVQSAIATALSSYLNNQYFGSIIQLSSVLEAIASVGGVQNVRWSNDLPVPSNQIRVIETDINGDPLNGVAVDRYAPYSAAAAASFTLQVTGTNFAATDTYTLSWNDTVLGVNFTTAPISYTATTTQIASAINTVMTPKASPYISGVTVSILYTSTDSNNHYTQYLITYSAAYTVGIDQPVLPTVLNSVSQGSYLYNEDFFLLDSQLPSLPIGQVSGDTLPGLIARTRAENTFYRPGIG